MTNPTLPNADELEVVAWRWPEPQREGGFLHSVTNVEPPCSGWEDLVTLSSAQAQIEAVREANEALMKERASLIKTKREQIERLTRERDEARLLVVEANNSLFGSQGYFHSLNGGDFDRWHLAKEIEKLKTRSRRAEAAEAEVKRLEPIVQAVAHIGPRRPRRHGGKS